MHVKSEDAYCNWSGFRRCMLNLKTHIVDEVVRVLLVFSG